MVWCCFNLSSSTRLILVLFLYMVWYEYSWSLDNPDFWNKNDILSAYPKSWQWPSPLWRLIEFLLSLRYCQVRVFFLLGLNSSSSSSWTALTAASPRLNLISTVTWCCQWWMRRVSPTCPLVSSGQTVTGPMVSVCSDSLRAFHRRFSEIYYIV